MCICDFPNNKAEPQSMMHDDDDVNKRRTSKKRTKWPKHCNQQATTTNKKTKQKYRKRSEAIFRIKFSIIQFVFSFIIGFVCSPHAHTRTHTHTHISPSISLGFLLLFYGITCHSQEFLLFQVLFTLFLVAFLVSVGVCVCHYDVKLGQKLQLKIHYVPSLSDYFSRVTFMILIVIIKHTHTHTYIKG